MSNKKTPTVGQQAGEEMRARTTGNNSSNTRTRHVDDLLKAARWYATNGLKVGTLNGKQPIGWLVPHGYKDFTSDLDKVTEWWGRYPAANIGACPPRGHVVIDVDVNSGGLEYWHNLCKGHDLPETFTVKTGSGGWHYWFLLPHDGQIYGHLSGINSGIDLKTNTGYLVMPPSIHPTTGRAYELHSCADPAPLPTWLHSHVYRPPKPPAPARRAYQSGNAAKGLIGKVASAVEGNRNRVLYWAACRAVDEGLMVADELIQAGIDAGLPPVEAQRTVTRVFAHAKEVA